MIKLIYEEIKKRLDPRPNPKELPLKYSVIVKWSRPVK